MGIDIEKRYHELSTEEEKRKFVTNLLDELGDTVELLAYSTEKDKTLSSKELLKTIEKNQ